MIDKEINEIGLNKNDRLEQFGISIPPALNDRFNEVRKSFELIQTPNRDIVAFKPYDSSMYQGKFFPFRKDENIEPILKEVEEYIREVKIKNPNSGISRDGRDIMTPLSFNEFFWKSGGLNLLNAMYKGNVSLFSDDTKGIEEGLRKTGKYSQKEYKQLTDYSFSTNVFFEINITAEISKGTPPEEIFRKVNLTKMGDFDIYHKIIDDIKNDVSSLSGISPEKKDEYINYCNKINKKIMNFNNTVSDIIDIVINSDAKSTNY